MAFNDPYKSPRWRFAAGVGKGIHGQLEERSVVKGEGIYGETDGTSKWRYTISFLKSTGAFNTVVPLSQSETLRPTLFLYSFAFQSFFFFLSFGKRHFSIDFPFSGKFCNFSWEKKRRRKKKMACYDLEREIKQSRFLIVVLIATSIETLNPFEDRNYRLVQRSVKICFIVCESISSLLSRLFPHCVPLPLLQTSIKRTGICPASNAIRRV